MKFTPSTEIVSSAAVVSKRRSTHARRAVVAAVMASSFAATFAVPAYAEVVQEDPIAYAVRTGNFQGFTPKAESNQHNSAVALQAQHLVSPVTAEDQAKAEAEKARQEAELKKAEQQKQRIAAAASTVPTGAGASGLVAAARAQIGINQDCTDLVQNALAAIGLTARRDQGGYDHSVADFARYGTRVSAAEARPGDILISGSHVAIYTGGGSAVHGGYLGYRTVEVGGGISNPGAYYMVIRLP